MAKVFTYNKTPVSVDRLTEEIRSSAITAALDYINLFGANLDIFFKADLPEGDSALLDQIVEAHTGEPLPAELATSIAVGRQLGYYNPSPQAFEVGKASITVDAEQKLINRGQTYTDEGSFRDSFPGDSLFKELSGTFFFSDHSDEIMGDGVDLSEILTLYPYIKLSTDPDSAFTQGVVKTNLNFSLEETYRGSTGSGSAILSNWFPETVETGAISVSNSRLNLSTGTTDGAAASIHKHVDYLPFRLQILCKTSQRIANQEMIIGAIDPDKGIQATVIFTGTNNKVCIFRTSSDSNPLNTQETVCTIPYGGTTNSDHVYIVEVINSASSLIIDDVLVATHRDHIPDAYDILGITLKVSNIDTAASSTTLSVHWVTFQNVDQIDIINSFTSVPVKTKLTSPSALDGKPFVSTTSRPIGTFTYLSSQSDDPDNALDISSGSMIKFNHKVGDTDNVRYYDINAIANETHLHTAVMQWGNAILDEIKCEVVPKVTEVSDGTGTNYTTTNGILVATPPGYGNKVVDWNNVYLIELVPNEFNILPPGFWDATFNTSTGLFENITFNAAGTGKYNIFVEEKIFHRFVPGFVMLNDGMYEVKSNDESRIGHNMRFKTTINTVGDDHDWMFTAAFYLFRKKTV